MLSKNKKGFTLIELLVVSSMLIFLGVGIFRILSSGIAVYEWMDRNRFVDDVPIFFQKFSNDIRNYAPMGKEGILAIPGGVSLSIHNADYMVYTDPDSITPGEPVRRVEYIYDRSKKNILRRVYSLGREDPVTGLEVLAGVKAMRITYAEKDGILRDAGMFSDVPPARVAAIRVELEINSGAGDDLNFSRVIEVPVNFI
ncbi:MAG: type II secretion system protein [Candidatus Omnitrophica bacterium]|nr:type II secretion system protein [Candidatus Omnitrophota bacterium]